MEERIREAIDKVIGAEIPYECPPVLLGAEGPTVEVQWINKLDPAEHVGSAEITCTSIHKDSGVCQACILYEAVIVQFEQNCN